MAALKLPVNLALLTPVTGPGGCGTRWPAEKFVSPVIKSEGESAVDRFQDSVDR